MFRFIETEKASFPVAFLCRSLGVSPSGYYAWRKRPPSACVAADAVRSTAIRQVHVASRGTYSAPRIRAELVSSNQTRCGRNMKWRGSRRPPPTGSPRPR